MRIAMFDDYRIGVVGKDETVVDVTDLLQRHDPLGSEDLLPDLITHFDVLRPELERLAKGGGGKPLMRVEDGGAGVPSEAMARIFEKFYRVPARRGSARHGTGLGLAVVKGMTEAMGGTVTAVRSDLGGLAVDLRLPIAAAPAEEPAG